MERYAVQRFARTGVEKAMVAGIARMVVRLVKRHPLVAAELLIAGTGHVGKIGWMELERRLDDTSNGNPKPITHSVPLITSSNNGSDQGGS
ncbi:hypothetical protein ATY81_22105 [Rhizobium sp. R72]|nr:hypothetical protein ATY81_22105 [Rhizobium sp. R72]OWW02476.1 hypothetical protein ATY80_22105 [Rhizobium sp. R711]